MTWKVLNLYAGIGGNRKLWEDVEVTAIEWNRQIAEIYQDLFPDDLVLEVDAHQFLLENFHHYDFIWASPPCPTHSRIRKSSGSLKEGKIKPVYPDMKLYQEIIFLEGYFKGKYCVENVIGYYEPLVRPQEVNRHYFWANFFIPKKQFPRFNIEHNRTDDFMRTVGFDLSPYRGIDKKTIMRNCVNPGLGKHILDSARRETQRSLADFQSLATTAKVGELE